MTKLMPMQYVPSDIAGRISGDSDLPPLTRPSAGLQQKLNSPIVRQVFPPWLYPLPHGNDFTSLNVFTTVGATTGPVGKTAVLPAVVGSVINSEPVKIPRQMAGVLRVLNIFVDAPGATIDVDWITLIDGAPVQGWRVSTFPRAANNLSIAFPGVLRLHPGAILSVAIQNNAATGPWTVGVQLSGWYWSIEEAKVLYGDLY